jgi:hypothetical protein
MKRSWARRWRAFAHPTDAGWLSDKHPRTRGVVAPELCFRFALSAMRGRREGRVSTDTRGPRATKKARGRNHRFSRTLRPSLRDGFTAYSALSPGTGLFCSRHARDHHLARLTSASGGQDHTPLLYASTSLVRRDPHVHRISASRVVTIAIRPLASRRDGCTILLIYRIRKAEYFLRQGWTAFLKNCPTGKSVGLCGTADAEEPWRMQSAAKRTRGARDAGDVTKS